MDVSVSGGVSVYSRSALLLSERAEMDNESNQESIEWRRFLIRGRN